MINDLPTIFEVVTGSVKKQGKDKSLVSNNSSNKSKTGSKGVSQIFSILFHFHLMNGDLCLNGVGLIKNFGP